MELKVRLKKLNAGEFTVVDTVCVVETDKGDKEVQLDAKMACKKR